MNIKTLFIHPGFPKTGTTTFQKLLEFLNINILAKPNDNFFSTPWFYLFRNYLIKKKNYDELKINFKNYLKTFFNNQKTISVYSDEGLLGNDHNYIDNIHIFKEIIEEIENELDIKIVVKFIFTIRRQHDMILSTYYYDQKYHEDSSLTEFFEKIINLKEYKNLFDFALIIKKIKKIFDSDILILPIELLKKDQNKYIDELLKFINLESYNVNISNKLIELNKNYTIVDSKKRYFYRNKKTNFFFNLFSVIYKWLKKNNVYKIDFINNAFFQFIYKAVKPREKRILAEKNENTEFFQNEIKNIYKDSNLELEKLAKINMKEFGYY